MEPTAPVVAFDPFLPITTLLAVALTALLLWLVIRIVRVRIGDRVSLGTGGSEPLERLTRAHGNLVETAPFALVLAGLAEVQGAPWWLLGPTALVFLIGRVLHALAFTGARMSFPKRSAGMQMTVYALAGLAVTALGSLWGTFDPGMFAPTPSP